MANNLSRRHPIIVDTVGLVWRGKGFLRAIELVPNAAGDQVVLTQYSTVAPISGSTLQITGSITSGTTLTDDDTENNKLTSTAFPQYSLLKIRKSTGSSNNTKDGGVFLITTAGNDDRVICSDASFPLTNESNKVYEIEAYAGTVFYHLLSPATDKQGVGRYFDGGLEFENLAVTTLTTGAKVYLYID